MTVRPWVRPNPPNPLVLSISGCTGYTLQPYSTQHGYNRVVVMGFDDQGKCIVTETKIIDDTMLKLKEGDNTFDISKDQADIFTSSNCKSLMVWVMVNYLKNGDPPDRVIRIEDVESWKKP